MSASQSSSSNSSSTQLPPRTPTKKKSMRDLNTTMPLGGRPKASGSFARAATISLQPSPRSSPGHGLTLRIEDDMAEYGKTKGIQSAPVRPSRRLPALPPPPLPPVIVEDAPFTPLLTPVPHSSAPPARAKRALPCPPTPVIESQTPTHSVTATATPVERRRRPLPIPIPPAQKSDTPLHNNPSPAIGTSKSLPISNSLSKLPMPKIPSPSLIATFPHPETMSPKTRRHHHSASEKIPGKMLPTRAPRRLHASRSSIDLTLDVVQLHRKFVVERSPVCISLDCDTASEDEYAEEIRSTAVFARDVPAARQKEKSGSDGDKHDKELHADYAWLLSNRILHHQKSSEARVTSKWMCEKKGKRYTEEDFDNILNALRNL